MAQKPDAKAGLSVGVGYWLGFMLCFALLGYTYYLSIGFGAIGGLAAGLLAALWNAKEEEDAPAKSEMPAAKQEAEAVVEETPKTHFRKYGAGGTKQRRKRRTGWLFRKDS